MNETEADRLISEYRALLKRWTMCTVGLESGDADAMQSQLDRDELTLSEITQAFPRKAYSVDLLVNARKRTWAGYAEERIERVGQVRR